MRYAYEIQTDRTKTVHAFADESSRVEWIAACPATRGLLSGNSKRSQGGALPGHGNFRNERKDYGGAPAMSNKHITAARFCPDVQGGRPPAALRPVRPRRFRQPVQERQKVRVRLDAQNLGQDTDAVTQFSSPRIHPPVAGRGVGPVTPGDVREVAARVRGGFGERSSIHQKVLPG